jgi:DNA-directed RNA polymerase specialized sigma24 family protein
VFVKSEQEQPAIFAERFSRAYRLLDFIACRVLRDEKRAHIAIHNCWQTASDNPPSFEYEGAFRSWLVRILIDEAVVILRESQERERQPMRQSQNMGSDGRRTAAIDHVVCAVNRSCTIGC